MGAGCQRTDTREAVPQVAASAAVSTASVATLQTAAGMEAPRHVEFGSATPSEAARTVAERAVVSNDAGKLPFLIVDKAMARVLAFDAEGRFIGDTAALLGSARGDDSAPGIGDKPIARIRPEERTTPAGRFVAELGENTHGEDILWVDYDNAVSMHRVRAVKASERRLQRLASNTVDDNRISYGCINVPAPFFDNVVKPLFERSNGVVYVLPETRSVDSLFVKVPVASLRQTRQ